MRKIALGIVVLIALFFVARIFLHLLLNSVATDRFEWGHHFTFENELGISLDSVMISVGGVKTTIIADVDSNRILEGKVDVPKQNYPHEVQIVVSEGGHLTTLTADSFDCYNCDGSHYYYLTTEGAKYEFRN